MDLTVRDHTKKFTPQDRRQHHGEGILASIGILFFVPMITSPNSRYCRFWVRQGMALLITDLLLAAAGLLLSWLFGLLAAIPLIGFLFAVLRVLTITVLSACFAFITFLSIYYACRGWARELPIFAILRRLCK